MPLTNPQYDAVMRHYDALRERSRYEQNARTEEVYRRIPEMSTLDDEIARESMRAARARIENPDSDLGAYQSAMKAITLRRQELLRNAGYPADYLEAHYECPLCRDTGFVDAEKCACFDRISADLLYGTRALREELLRENFDHFSFDCYSDTIVDSTTGLTPRASARHAYAAAREAAEAIGHSAVNLYLCGNTGTGKTFLAHCIMKAALDGGHYALCFSAADFFDVLGGSYPSSRRGSDPAGSSSLFRNGTRDTAKAMIRESELLIIDDLGTELVNAFTSSELFRVINERLTEKRSTIISTNLSLGHLSEKYSERVFSRIASHYRVIRLTGEDIRIQSRLL